MMGRFPIHKSEGVPSALANFFLSISVCPIIISSLFQTARLALPTCGNLSRSLTELLLKHH